MANMLSAFVKRVRPGKRSSLLFYFPTAAHYDRRMGLHLYRNDRLPFRHVIDACDALVRQHLELSLVERYFANSRSIRERHNAFSTGEPALTAAVQLALLACYRQRGVEPDVVIGECGGEIAAAHAVGALSLEEAMEVACATWKHVEHPGYSLPGFPYHYLTIDAPAADVESLCSAAGIEMYVTNELSDRSTVAAARTGSAGQLSGLLEQQGISYRENPVELPAAHCPASDPTAKAFFEAISHIRPRPCDRPAFSFASIRPLSRHAFDAYHFVQVFFGRQYHAPVLREALQRANDALLVLGVTSHCCRWVSSFLPDDAPQPVPAVDLDANHADPIEMPLRTIRSANRRGWIRFEPRAESDRRVAAVEPTEVDFFSEEVQHDPYPCFRRLRRHEPVTRSDQLGGYLVSRYADVVTMLKTPQTFSSSLHAEFDPVLVAADPPRQTQVRELLSEPFHKKSVLDLEPSVRRLTDACIDRLIDGGRGELLQDVAEPLPVHVIAEVLGLDADAFGPDVIRWSDAAVSMARPQGAAKEFDAFLRDQLREAGKEGGAGLLGIIAHGKPGGNPLSLDEQVSLARLMIVAGRETTTHVLASAVLALLRYGHVYRKLRRRPEDVPAFIEEVLRIDPPVISAQRVTTQSAQVAHAELPTGSRVYGLLGSANHDESVFEAPDEFRMHRMHPHLAFGTGPHVCVGMHLARLEVRVFVERLLERTLHFWCDQPLEFVRRSTTPALRRVERLPLRLIPR